MSYFTNCNSLEELKKQYYSLVMKYHPDVNKSPDATRITQEINAEYDVLFPQYKYIYNRTAKTPTNETASSTRSEFYTRNGWKGKNYNSNLSTVDIAKIIREYVKKIYFDCKFSITSESYSGGSSFTVALMEAPYQALKNNSGYEQLNHYYLKEDKNLSEKALSMLLDILKLINSYRRDDSDSQIDYFDTNFYYSIHVGKWNKKFEVVEKQAKIKAPKEQPAQKQLTENNNDKGDNKTMDAKTYIDTMQKKTKEGITAIELQEYYTFLRDNSEAVKAVIMDKLNNSEKHKNKRKATKESLCNECYDNMLTDLVYCVQETFSFMLDFSGTHKETERKAIEQVIFNATDEQIQKRLEQKKEADAARKAYYSETIAAIKDPQTLEDFKQVKLYRKTPLTDDEQELFDYLTAIHNKEQRKKERQERAEKAKVIITGLSDKYTITADKDTRDNSDLWVVKLNNRLDKDAFNTIRYNVMKPLDGYYSSFKGGFIFKYDPTIKLLGEQTENTITETQEEQPKNSADKLRKVADNIQNTIDDLRKERLTNTAKRARQAASAEDTAEAMERTQNIIRNIAQAMDNSELKLINAIDSKAQIDTLNQILIRANIKKKDVEKIEYRMWYETTPTTDIIKYAEIPSSIIYKDQLQRIIFDIRKEDGFKLISNRLQKLINNTTGDKIDITGLEDEFDKIYKNTDVLKGQYFESAIEERRRLERMGINSVEELRAYLREYWTYKTAVKTTIDPKQRKIKELEREYKLNQKGDINFTPSEIALTMIELADIDNNSKVLEPSAGIGNIADQIKKFTDNVDVCEQMFSYCELLKLKGFNVVGNDFLKLNTYNTYDYIIMNPPFSDEQNHIKHAFDLLKVGGKIVSITSPHWTFANDRASQEFRNWFDDMGGEIVEELESGTFEMTGVRTQIIVISKDINTMKEAI